MRLHCKEHGYMDEKTGPMAECPYCRVEQLEQELAGMTEMYEELYEHHAAEKHSGELVDTEMIRQETAMEIYETLAGCFWSTDFEQKRSQIKFKYKLEEPE